VVPGANYYGRALRDGWWTLTGHPREPHTDLLQPPQAARRFGEPEVSCSRCSLSGLVGWRYLGRELSYPVFEGQS